MKLGYVLSAVLAASVVTAGPVKEDVINDEEYQRFVSMPDGDGNLQLVDLEAPANEEILEQIARDPGNEYWLYTRNNPNNPQVLQIGNVASVTSSNFVAGRHTIVIAHGGFHSGLNEPNPIIRGVYLARHDANIITVDWSRVAQNDYVTAVRGVPDVGRAVGDFVAFLHTSFGASYDNMHFVGFSLGAHVVGIAGRRVGGQVARITGLDPAGPLWINNPDSIGPNDGVYVEAIHTDGAYPGPGVGIGRHIVQVDFFPNGGTLQPGCITNVCNHNRAYELFAATITHNHLIGRHCTSYTQVGLNACTGVLLNMGNDNLRKTGNIGRYRVNTSSSYPF